MRNPTLATMLWTAAFLLLADAGAGRLFPRHDTPSRPLPALAQYFEFGRSVEGKLRWMVRPTDDASAPVTLSGWLEPFNIGDAPLVPARPGGHLVAVYGQSFAFRAAEPIAAADSSITLRLRGGPASPPSHCFALWSLDRGRVHPDVAILGVLASSLRGMDAMTAATWQFESPAPYTYPRYSLAADGTLRAEWPRVRSMAQLRATLADPAAWRAWLAQLRAHDAWFDPLLFVAGPADQSVIARLLRRAWGQRAQREHLGALHGPRGFREDAEAVRVLRRQLVEFADGCRADGVAPVVLLIEDRGYADHLERALGPVLEAHHVPWVATHRVADPLSPATFGADAHFTPEANARVAAAVRAAFPRTFGGFPRVQP